MLTRLAAHSDSGGINQICSRTDDEVLERIVSVEMEATVDGVAGGYTGNFFIKACSRVFGFLVGRKNEQLFRSSFGLGPDKQTEVHRSAEEGRTGVVESAQMVLAEPVQEEPVGTINMEFPIVPLSGPQGGEPGVEGLLGYLLSDDT